MRVQFYVRFHTKFGEGLYISGNANALGNLDTQSAVAMQYMSNDYWKLETEIDEVDGGMLRYKYFFRDSNGEWLPESGYNRTIGMVQEKGIDVVKVYDVWNYSCAFDNAFFTSPYKKKKKNQPRQLRIKMPQKATHIFII